MILANHWQVNEDKKLEHLKCPMKGFNPPAYYWVTLLSEYKGLGCPNCLTQPSEEIITQALLLDVVFR